MGFAHDVATVRVLDSPTMVSREDTRPPGAGTTAERWAVLVLRALECSSDPKTLSIWARTANVSRSALCEYCRMVHVSPHSARNFARVLRAVVRSDRLWQPEAVMDVADARTLRKLQERAGLAYATSVPTPDEFLDRQKWIPQSNPGLIALRAMLNREARSVSVAPVVHHGMSDLPPQRPLVA